MSRVSAFLVLCVLSTGGAAQAQSPNAVTHETTTTATVERIERSSRVVTLRAKGNVLHSVYVEPAVKAFDDLKVGDVVTVRYTESVIVEVRPGAKLAAPQDTTADAKAADAAVEEQLKAVVKIASIDPQRLFVTYRTQDNVKIVHPVRNKQLLDGIRVGDTVAITLTRARAVSIERPRR